MSDQLEQQQAEAWMPLPPAAWDETRATLHMWTQIVGKIRMELSPHVNHWWHVPLYVTARGLTTSSMPYGTRLLEIEFDFLGHELVLQSSDNRRRTLSLTAQPVADFYASVMDALHALGVEIAIWTTPVEVEDRTPFEEDTHHASYDSGYVNRFWRTLVQVDRVLTDFRSWYLGKVSPVHFFWGSFDMAVTRFSGRPAPPHPGGPNVARYVMVEAYSDELSSAGWWPGGGGIDQPMFYAYAYPEPEGFKAYPARPEAAYYSEELGEFLLPYEAVRTAANPDEALLGFLQSTYEAAAVSGNWDRDRLERAPGPWRREMAGSGEAGA